MPATCGVAAEVPRKLVAGTLGDNFSMFLASFPFGRQHIEVVADDGRRASLEFEVTAGDVPPPLEMQFPAKR